MIRGIVFGVTVAVAGAYLAYKWVTGSGKENDLMEEDGVEVNDLPSGDEIDDDPPSPVSATVLLPAVFTASRFAGSQAVPTPPSLVSKGDRWMDRGSVSVPTGMEQPIPGTNGIFPGSLTAARLAGTSQTAVQSTTTSGMDSEESSAPSRLAGTVEVLDVPPPTESIRMDEPESVSMLSSHSLSTSPQSVFHPPTEATHQNFHLADPESISLFFEPPRAPRAACDPPAGTSSIRFDPDSVSLLFLPARIPRAACHPPAGTFSICADPDSVSRFFGPPLPRNPRPTIHRPAGTYEIRVGQPQAADPVDAEEPPEFETLYAETGLVLGRGSFGQVAVVTRKASGELRVCKSLNEANVYRRGADGYPLEVTLHEMCQGHPNIVSLEDAYYSPELKLFRLVMPFHPGAKNLSEWLAERHGLIDLPILKKLIVDLLDGMAHIHGQGVVHSDIKPLNILIVWENGNYTAKIFDFGEAVPFVRGQRSFLPVGGTEAYAPPEFDLAAIKVEGPEMDIFSLGVTFYEMVFNRLPFEDRATINNLTEEISVPILAPGSDGISHHRVPFGLTCLIVGMTAKNHRHRLTLNRIRASPWLAS